MRNYKTTGIYMSRFPLIVFLSWMISTSLCQTNSAQNKVTWIQDSVKTYKSSTDSWRMSKILFDTSELIVNDSIEINKGVARLVNLHDTSRIFKPNPTNYSKIEVVDSTRSESTHWYYELKDQTWMLKKKITHHYTKSKKSRIETFISENDIYKTELSNTYFDDVLITNTQTNKYSNGEVSLDTLLEATLDPSGNILTDVKQGFKNENGEIPIFSKGIYQYNEDNLVISDVSFDQVNGELTELHRETYRYDENKRLVYKKVFQEHFNRYDFEVWYTYDDHGNCIRQYYEQNDDGYAFVLKEFTYNDQKQMTNYVHKNKSRESDPYGSMCFECVGTDR